MGKQKKKSIHIGCDLYFNTQVSRKDCTFAVQGAVGDVGAAHLVLWPHRSSGAKKQQAHESSRPLSIERPGAVHPWVSAQLRTSVQPSHLFIQDPTMPPNPAPNPLTQLEEARRRLEEEEKRASKAPSRQRYGTSGEQGCLLCGRGLGGQVVITLSL